MLNFRSLFLVFFVLSKPNVSAAEIITCSNKTTLTKLDNGKFVWFQSNNFPFSMNHSNNIGFSNSDCFGNFQRTDNNGSLWFVFLNGGLRNFGIESNNNYQDIIWDNVPLWYSYFTNYPTLNFNHNQLFKDQTWESFQAFVYTPPNSNEEISCPLNGLTLNLTSETQIIPITSSYYFPAKKLYQPITCNWIFNIPTNYKLKLNVKQFQISQTDSLTVISDANPSMAIKTASSQSFDGKLITIYFKSISPITTADVYGFGGYVTLENSNPTIIVNNCKYSSNNGIFKFSNLNPTTSGYENNENCLINFNLPKKSKAYQISYDGNLEENGDSLIFIDSKGNQMKFSNYYHNWIIDTDIAKLNFISDGSVISQGFDVTIKSASCECTNNVQEIYCDDLFIFKLQSFDIMKNATTISNEYCPGMTCPFMLTVPNSCQFDTLLLRPNVQLRKGSKDIMKIYVNGKQQFSFNYPTTPINHLIVKPTDNITINFQSDSAVYGLYQAPMASFGVIGLASLQENIEIKLNINNFTYAMDLKMLPFSRFFIVTAPNGYIMDLFISGYYSDSDLDTKMKNYYIYDSVSINNYVGTILDLPWHNSMNRIRYYSTKNGALSLLSLNEDTSSYPRGTAFFRLRKLHTDNCLTEDNIININSGITTFKSGAQGSCFLTILSESCGSKTQYLNLKSDSSSLVALMAGTDSTFTFFNFNNNDSTTSQKTYEIYGLANSFVIPGNTTISFAAENNTNVDQMTELQKSSTGILTSPTYADPNGPLQSKNEFVIPNKTTCVFTVKFLDLSSNAILNLNNLFGNEILKIISDTKTFSHSTAESSDLEIVSLNLQEPEKGHRGYLIGRGATMSTRHYVDQAIMSTRHNVDRTLCRPTIMSTGHYVDQP